MERLHAIPELRVEEIAVGAQEDLAQLAVEADEGQEYFGKHVVGTHVEPRLGRHLLLERARLGQAAEVALREGRQLVVVVEDNATVARDPEVLQQEVAREMFVAARSLMVWPKSSVAARPASDAASRR